MDGYYLWGTRDGCHPSVIASGRATEDGKRFVKARYDYWKSQKQGFDHLLVMHIYPIGWTRVVPEWEMENW